MLVVALDAMAGMFCDYTSKGGWNSVGAVLVVCADEAFRRGGSCCHIALGQPC